MKTRSQNKNKDLLIRAATIDVRAEGDAPAKVYMSVSSEEPVLSTVCLNGEWIRAYEILDHSGGSVNPRRMQEGLVILDRHYGDQVGLMRVEKINGKIGGFVEFCSGARAQEIAQDAAKGLRRNVSVGYTVDASKYRIEGEQDGVPVVRAMSWMPYEASFEPVPADATVGVNRAEEVKTKAVAQEKTVARKEEDNMEPKELAKLFERAASHGIDAAEVTKLVEDGKGRAELDAMIVEKQRKESEAMKIEIRELKERKPEAPKAQTVPVIGGSDEAQEKIVRKYSLMNVLRSAAGMKVDTGYEREVSEECAKLRQKPANGIIVPFAALAKRDFTVAGTSSSSVSTNLYSSEFIDLLRTYMRIGQAGCKYLTGLVGNVAIPKMTAGCTGYWVAEGGDITESQPTLGQVTGTPHTTGVMTDISRRLLIQSTPDAEMMVRDEMVQRIARTLQVAVFQGTGADGQPSKITTASGINNPAVTQGTPTYTEMLGFPGAILADSAPADGQKWIGTAEVWEKLAGTSKDSGSGQFVLNPDNNMMMGREFLVTEDVGANSLFFGDFSQVVIGIWGNGVDINADTATLSSSGGLRLVALQDVDVMVRLGQALAYNTAVTA